MRGANGLPSQAALSPQGTGAFANSVLLWPGVAVHTQDSAQHRKLGCEPPAPSGPRRAREAASPCRSISSQRAPSPDQCASESGEEYHRGRGCDENLRNNPMQRQSVLISERIQTYLLYLALHGLHGPCSTVTFCWPLPRCRFRASSSTAKLRDSLLAWFRFSRRPLKRLSAVHGAPIAFHGSIVCGDELRRDHSLDLVFGRDANQRRHCGFALSFACLFIGMLDPKRYSSGPTATRRPF